jgi:aminoglycoside phosphotransferase (APT) family kinase protein
MNSTSVRPSWPSIPPKIRSYVEARLDADVVLDSTAGGGYTPGLASHLVLADGRAVFLKGMSSGHPFAAHYRDEVLTTAALPVGVGPRPLWWAAPEESSGWWLLCLEYVSGREPDLSPGSADLAGVVRAVGSLGDRLTPCPAPQGKPVASVVGDWYTGWSHLAEEVPEDLDPWAARNITRLAGIERDWQSASAGDTLIHGDVRPDNMIVGEGGLVTVIDWSYPFIGAPWLDAAQLVPQLMLAGHGPAEAEALIGVLPQPSPEVLTAYAAGLGGYWERSARRPAPPGVPHLRAYQARAARAALAWLKHRTGWS